MAESSSSTSSAAESSELPNEQAVARRWSMLRQELNQLYSKITEMEMELSEHSLVINAISSLDQNRKCFRMIGGVLVERTVAEVLPAVQRNKEGLQEVITRLSDSFTKKKKELADFEAKYKIKIRKTDELGSKKEEPSTRDGTAQGVLVA